MLHLAARTDPSWGTQILPHMDEILLDHAHCEKKAASTALSLIFRYPHIPHLMVPLTRLAREELAHFEEVLDHIRRRGGEFRRQQPSAYAAELMTVVRTHEPARLVDTLLCCALIEARSCERMQLVADALERSEPVDTALVHLYRGLLACEARHHRSYVDLARELRVMNDEALELRLREIAEHEASVIAKPATAPRLHAAVPGGSAASTASPPRHVTLARSRGLREEARHPRRCRACGLSYVETRTSRCPACGGAELKP